MKRERDSYRTTIVAEEEGLVTVHLAADAPTLGRSLGVRLRLRPPKSTLREDGHVFDLDGALSFADERIFDALPDARWTDTVIGCERVTVSFVVATKADAEALVARLDALAVQPYAREQTAVEAANLKRLQRLSDAVVHSVGDEATKPSASLGEALARRKRSFSLRSDAQLDTAKPSIVAVKKALRALEDELAAIEPAVRSALGVASDVRLMASINSHPRMRRFDFILRGGEEEDEHPIPAGVIAQIEAHLDAPQADARRIAGILWDAEIDAIEGLSRVELGVWS